MRKINRLAVCLMCVSILLCACGKETDKEVGAIESGETQTISQDEDVSSTGEEQTEAVSEDDPVVEEEEHVYNNGGNFIKVDDCVYYFKLSEEAVNRSVLYGKFRGGSKETTDSYLMCYDTVTGETKEIATLAIGTPMAYYRGAIYLTQYDESFTGSLVEVNLSTGEITNLGEAYMRYVDPETGRYVAEVYAIDGTSSARVYEGRKPVSELDLQNVECGVDNFFLCGDTLLYCMYHINYWDSDGEMLHQLFAYQLSTGELKCLGDMPAEPDEGLDPLCEVDQMAIKDNEVYLGVGFYAGTGHFLNYPVICKADLTRENSLEIIQEEDIVDAFDYCTDRFLESSLPKIVACDYIPYEVQKDYETDQLYLMVPDGNDSLKRKDVIQIDKMGVDYSGEEFNYVEVAEYVDGKIYVVMDEVVYCEEESVGWRDAYTVNAISYCEIDPATGEMRELEPTMQLPEMPKPIQYYVENPSKDNCNTVDLAGYEAKPATITLEYKEANEIIDEEEWFTEYGLEDMRYTDTGQYDFYAAFDDPSVQPMGYTLYITDKETGEVKYELDLSDFYYPVGVAEHPGLEDGWYPEFQCAYAEDDIVYLSMFHRTYAETMPYHAYIMAIDLTDGSLLWKSENLVNNALHFVVLDNVIVCGYGFTDEPDYIYQLDKKSGATLEQIKVKTGPDYLYYKDGKLYVRTYDMNYVFDVEQ